MSCLSLLPSPLEKTCEHIHKKFLEDNTLQQRTKVKYLLENNVNAGFQSRQLLACMNLRTCVVNGVSLNEDLTKQYG